MPVDGRRSNDHRPSLRRLSLTAAVPLSLSQPAASGPEPLPGWADSAGGAGGQGSRARRRSPHRGRPAAGTAEFGKVPAEFGKVPALCIHIEVLFAGVPL